LQFGCFYRSTRCPPEGHARHPFTIADADQG
jgi:hypothetical protein